MAGYYEQKQSIAALWCMRLAVFAVPYFILTIYLHRTGGVSTEQAFWLMAFGIGLLIAAILLGLKAAIDLWEKGYKGGRTTANGITLAALLLAPFGYQLVQALDKPKLNDLATDISNPPIYLEDKQLKNYSPYYDSFSAQDIVAAYPQISTRRYNTSAERVYESVEKILKQWRWQVVSGLNVPEQKQNLENEADLELEGDPKKETEEIVGFSQTEIFLQVSAKSLIMQLDSNLMIRLSPDDFTTLVDVRSRSHWSPHDFGSNARNIDDFLKALDEALAGVAGEV